MGKHTPTPWLARDYLCDNGDVWIDCNVFANHGKGHAVAGTIIRVLANGTGDDVTAADNAAFVELAVNSHDDLVEALGDTTRILEAVRLSAGLGKSQLERLAKAKIALANAKGGAQ